MILFLLDERPTDRTVSRSGARSVKPGRAARALNQLPAPGAEVAHVPAQVFDALVGPLGIGRHRAELFGEGLTVLEQSRISLIGGGAFADQELDDTLIVLDQDERVRQRPAQRTCASTRGTRL